MMNGNFDARGFLSNLESMLPKKSVRPEMDNGSSLLKINCGAKIYQGKFQLIPILPLHTGQPYTFLKRVREIKIPRSVRQEDGTTKEFHITTKILPTEAFIRVAPDGQIISSLTNSDEELLKRTHMAFDTLFELLGGNIKGPERNNPEFNKTITEGMRRRNYTLSYAYIVNHWNLSDPRNPTNISGKTALIINAASGFADTLKTNIADTELSFGAPETWMPVFYNRESTGRNGFVIFSCSIGMGGTIGYSLSMNHVQNPSVSNIVIPQEDIDAMKNPLFDFVGSYQSAADEVTGEFVLNRKVYEETLEYLNSRIAAVKSMAGLNSVQAATVTSNMALGTDTPQGPQTNDPFLKYATNQSGLTNPGAVVEGNVNPFQAPPVAQIDPISQAPVEPAPNFSSPNFASGMPF